MVFNKIYVFSTGYFSDLISNELENHNIQVLAVIDSFADDCDINSNRYIPVVHPNDADKKIPIVLGISRKGDIHKENLTNMGFETVILLQEALTIYPFLFERFCQVPSWPVNDESNFDLRMITYFKALLKDKESVNVLDSILSFRKNTSPSNYVLPTSELQYFPNDIPLLKNLDYISFVDCGAFIGDSIEQLNILSKHLDIKVKSCVSFEPDPDNVLVINEKQKEALYLNLMFSYIQMVFGAIMKF
ncbi:hypothetical protein [Shewanella halifaxensis]|uniref:hypothetical protein n=1 Tax=Shewanella halifaxensis TaxID=271098 RepID=UPI000D58FA1B|nr:hypothetical protein [Shewanella halifaxensis]